MTTRRCDACMSISFAARIHVLHGESNTSQASLRMTIQRICQPQEAVPPQHNQVILQPDTPAQKAKKSHKRSHEADAHTSHVHKSAPSRA